MGTAGRLKAQGHQICHLGPGFPYAQKYGYIPDGVGVKETTMI
jgi:hypothetical protein